MGPSRDQQNSPPHRVANLCVRALTQGPQIAEQQITENPGLEDALRFDGCHRFRQEEKIESRGKLKMSAKFRKFRGKFKTTQENRKL